MSNTQQAPTAADKITQLRAAANAAGKAVEKIERDLDERRTELQATEARIADRQWNVATGQAQQDDRADAQDALTVSGLREQIRVGEASEEEFRRRAVAAHEALFTEVGEELVRRATVAEENAHTAVRSLFPLLEALQDGFRSIEGAMEAKRQAFRAIDTFEPDTGKARALTTRASRKRLSTPDYVRTTERHGGKRLPEFAYLDEPGASLEVLAERVDDELLRLAAGGELPELLRRFVLYRADRDGMAMATQPQAVATFRRLMDANDEANERLVMGA